MLTLKWIFKLLIAQNWGKQLNLIKCITLINVETQKALATNFILTDQKAMWIF